MFYFSIYYISASTGSDRKTWRFLSYNKIKSVPSFNVNLLLKNIFIWKHFNYNIHFLNIVSVRWRPLLSAHSLTRRISDKSLKQSFDVIKNSKWRLSSWTFSFCSRRCFSAVPHPQQYSIATSDTVVPMDIEVPTKCPLSHNDRTAVLAMRLHSESPMLYRPALHGNWNALSLARMALKDKFPTPTIPLTAVLPNRQIFLPDPIFENADNKSEYCAEWWDNYWKMIWKGGDLSIVGCYVVSVGKYLCLVWTASP